MIIILKKSNVALICLIFLLSVAIYSLNIWGEDGSQTAVANGPQKTVLLDPGHGGEDPGAVSDYSGLKEKDVNLNIALKVKELLEKDGIRVLMTREEDKLEYQPDTRGIVEKRKQDLFRRRDMMNSSGADAVVSIHLNKFPQTKYFGAQVFYPPDSPGSLKLAQSLQKAVRESVDPNNTREALVKKDPIIILRDNKATTAIVECGFLSNAEEEKKLCNKEYQEKLAASIKDGITKFFSDTPQTKN